MGGEGGAVEAGGRWGLQLTGTTLFDRKYLREGDLPSVKARRVVTAPPSASF